MNFSLQHPNKPERINGSKRPLISFAFGVLMTALIFYVNWFNYPRIYFGNAIQNPQFYFYLTLILFLLMMLYLSKRITADTKYSTLLRPGLLLWIAGTTLKLSEQFVFQPHWVSTYLENFLRLSGILILSISGYKRIRSLEKMYSRANKIAKYDVLTLLPNRRFFINTVYDLSYTYLGLILIDIEHFKKINDKYGHAKGDKTLKKFGKLLSSYSS